MLLLKRKDGESITITDSSTGEKINVRVTKIFRGTVQLGITADTRFEIRRDDTQEVGKKANNESN